MAAGRKKLYTLTEVSKRTGISMPTLQRYKKTFQERIPSEGEGRKQRYPKAAFAVFEQLKKESLKKRGRPRKSGSGTAPKPSRRKAARKTAKKARGRRQSSGDSLLSLSEVGRRTGISYPTLVNYVKRYLDRIPHSGSGRKRRYPAEAVEVFRQIRSESRPGRPRKGTSPATKSGRTATVTDKRLVAQVRELERAQKEISKRLDTVLEILKRPMQVTIKGG